jgi:hypothetical protein
MSDDKPRTEKVPSGHVQAEGTLSGADDAQVYLDIAEALLSASTHPLIIADVQCTPRDGHTIVVVKADQSSDGTRAKKALAMQIEDWQAAV